jgi:methanogenic corrinoid protein MtbC1
VRTRAAASACAPHYHRVMAGETGTAAPAAAHRARYLDALLRRDARAARAVAAEAVAGGMELCDVYVDVLAPALHEVGHLWAVRRINVADEHFATTVTQGVLASLAPGERQPPTDGRLAVVCGTPDELHALGAQMVADLLERAGWEVLPLGAATPAADLVALVESECPDLVALSASTAGRLPGVAEVLERLDAARPRPLIAVGGGLFTTEGAKLAAELGADLVVSDLRTFLAEVRRRFPPVDPE